MENELSKLNKMKDVKKVILVTHQKPHIDELVAILLYHFLGHLVGVKVIDVEFVTGSAGSKEDDKIYIGIGGGELDEHVYDAKNIEFSNFLVKELVEIFGRSYFLSKDKKSLKISSVMLVAQKLGITNNPEYAEYMSLVKYAHHNDVNGAADISELGNLIKNKFNLGFKERGVLESVFDILIRKINVSELKRSRKEVTSKVLSYSLKKEYVSSNKKKYVFQNNSINRVVMPKHFSINQVIALKALQTYGSRFFAERKPENTFVKFVGSENAYKPKKGDLVIGLGKDEFAEFPALKMFDILRIKKDQKFKLLIDLAGRLNKSQGYHPWSLPSLLIERFIDEDCDSYGNFIFAMKEINVFIKKQEVYLRAKREVTNGFTNGKSKMTFSNNRRKIGVFQSDNKNIANVAFFEYHCDTVIVKNSKGQIFIQTRSYGKSSKKRQSNLESVAFGLRFEELKLKGYRFSKEEMRTFTSKGTLTICPEWHYQKATQTILNGSTSHSGVSPTQLSLDTIINIVKNQLK